MEAHTVCQIRVLINDSEKYVGYLSVKNLEFFQLSADLYEEIVEYLNWSPNLIATEKDTTPCLRCGILFVLNNAKSAFFILVRVFD